MPDIINLYPYEEFNPQQGTLPIANLTSSSSSSSSVSSSSSSSCAAACCTKKCIGDCCPDVTEPPQCCQFTADNLTDATLIFSYTVSNTTCCSPRCVSIPPASCIGECGKWHACNDAKWNGILNGVNLGIVDLNNESDGLSRMSVLTINEDQAKQIVRNNPCSLKLKLDCVNRRCHDTIGHVKMVLRDGVSVKCKDINGVEVYYGPDFFSKCVPPTGLNALTNCPAENCEAGSCYRLYQKIFSPESHYRNTIAGLTTENKIRFWGDKNYQTTLQEVCDTFTVPECSDTLCSAIVLYSDHGTYHKNSICPTIPGDSCVQQTEPPVSLYKHISFTTRHIALVSNSNKAEFIPNAICKNGSILNLNDFFTDKNINYICINDTDVLGGPVLNVPKILAVKTDGSLFTYDEPSLYNAFKYLDISDGTSWENAPYGYNLFGTRNLPIDIYYADQLHKDKTTGGNNRKIIQADFNEVFRVIRYDDNSIIINQTFPLPLLMNGTFPEIGYDYNTPMLTPPTWKDDAFDYVHLNKEVITAIRSSDKKLFIWGMYINNYPSGHSHRFITRNLDVINTLTDTTNPFIKTIYYSKVDTISAYFPDVYQDDVLFALKQDGTLMIFGNEDILYLYGISLTDAEYPANPWKKVVYSTVGGVQHYYYTLKDTDIKFKDFTVTGSTQDGSQESPNISISCILETGNTDQLEGQTWCFSFSLYRGQKAQIGYYGEANCCYTAGRSANVG